MQKSLKVTLINKIKYLVKIKKYLKSWMFNHFEKWLAKSTKINF
jgi:hypothetical protein